MSLSGAGANLFWQKASTLQLPGFIAKPACAHHQGHSQEGETSHEAEEMITLITYHKTDGSLSHIPHFLPVLHQISFASFLIMAAS